MPATDYRRWPSPRRMVSFSLCAGRWRSSKFVKKLPVGVPKPVWHLPHSTTLLFFWFHEKNVQKKKCLNLSRWSQNYYWVKSLLIVYISKLSWVTVTSRGSARAPQLLPQAEKYWEEGRHHQHRQTCKSCVFTYARGWIFLLVKWKYGESKFCRLEFDVDEREKMSAKVGLGGL